MGNSIQNQVTNCSYFQSDAMLWNMHFDDSAECTADSDVEDGELQKMLISPLCAQKASGKPDAMVMQERGVSAQFADRKESLRVSFI